MQPFMHLEALDTYQFLKDQIGTGYYEELVKTYLLDNPHASVVITVPEQGLGAKRDAALEKKLAEYKAGLSREERKKLIADTKHLKQYQEEPSPKEDLEKIPRLTRADLKKEAAPLLNREIETEGVSVIAHEMDTNGINYLTYLFDVRTIIPTRRLPMRSICTPEESAAASASTRTSKSRAKSDFTMKCARRCSRQDCRMQCA